MTDSETLGSTFGAEPTGEDTLCTTCKKLDFSIEKFVISNARPRRNKDAHSSASPGVTSDLPSPSEKSSSINNTNRELALSSGNARRVFATVGGIKQRYDSCNFCNLAFQAVDRYSGNRVTPNTELFLSWEVDGRKILESKRVINLTRRIRLSWCDRSGKEEMVYIVFVVPSGSQRLDSDSSARLSKSMHFLGRGLAVNKEKQALMKSWIDLCVDQHGPNCQRTHGARSEFMQLVKGTYFGVLDVIDMQLKELPVVNGEPQRYVALSYIWGKHPVSKSPYVTTRSNVMLHIQQGSLEKVWDSLPRTIQDAILLVNRLGERYLWIDSLCIVQDSNSSWELNAKSMHLVYGNAHFTICAADGDAETGLLACDGTFRTRYTYSNSQEQTSNGYSQNHSNSSSGVAASTATGRHRQRKSSPFPNRGLNSVPRSAHSVSNGSQMDDIRSQFRATDSQHHSPLTTEILKGIRVLVSRPPELVIQDSQWNQRGWTFQERLLSRRCLMFTEGQVYFQCRSAVISQHIFNDGSINGWTLDWTNSTLRTLGELRRRAFRFYMKCIYLYTGRSLTKPKDVLAAFQGVSWLLQEQMNAPLLYGLPMSHFDLALIWIPIQKLGRRKKKIVHAHRSVCSQDDMGNCQCKSIEEGYGTTEFPSWSWCGWEGGKAEYNLNMMEGCLINVQEWLRDHTWILWYVRDYEGNLRPLWDKSSLYHDQSEEERWRGYAGKPPRHTRIKTTEPLEQDYYARPRSPPVYKNRSSIHETNGGHRRPTAGTSGPWMRHSNQAYLGRLPPGYYEDDHNAYNDDNSESTRASIPHQPNSKSHQASADRASRKFPGPSYEAGASIRDTRETDSYWEAPLPYQPDVRFSRATRTSHSRAHRYEGRPLRPTAPYMPIETPYLRHAPPPTRSKFHKDREEASESYHSEESSRDESTYDAELDEQDTHNDGQEYIYNTRTRMPGGREAAQDSYGRSLRQELEGKNGMEFTGILPDNPFGVIRGPFPSDWRDHARAMPILQFWTWRTELIVTMRLNTDAHETKADTLPPSARPDVHMTTKLVPCDIADKSGDWCGAIVLPSSWITTREGIPLFFIALSDAKAFTNEECPVWNYYIPKERDESEWDLYYIMLLQRNRERALWERVAVGKVFKGAFGEGLWDEIKLG